MNTEECCSELELKSNGGACFLRVSSKIKNNLISRKIRNNRRGSGVVAMDSAEQQIHSTDNSAYCKQYESGTVIFDMVLSEFCLQLVRLRFRRQDFAFRWRRRGDKPFRIQRWHEDRHAGIPCDVSQGSVDVNRG